MHFINPYALTSILSILLCMLYQGYISSRFLVDVVFLLILRVEITNSFMVFVIEIPRSKGLTPFRQGDGCVIQLFAPLPTTNKEGTFLHDFLEIQMRALYYFEKVKKYLLGMTYIHSYILSGLNLQIYSIVLPIIESLPQIHSRCTIVA